MGEGWGRVGERVGEGGTGWDRVDRDGKYQEILGKKILVFQFFG